MTLALPVSQVIFKSVDTQAFAFAGKHCARVDAKEPVAGLSLQDFQTSMNALDHSFQSVANQSGGKIIFKSKFAQKDLYMAYMGSTTKSGVTIAYHNNGTGYTYTCRFK